MNEELLTRLVDALEGINSNLSDIAVSLDSVEKNLDGCVSVNGDNRFYALQEMSVHIETPHRYASTYRASNPTIKQIRVCG